MKIVNRGATFNNGKKVAESEYVNPIAADQLAKDVAVLADAIFQICMAIRCHPAHGVNELQRETDLAHQISERWSHE